jgi:hypothetical protein
MNLQTLRADCLAKPGPTKERPFGLDTIFSSTNYLHQLLQIPRPYNSIRQKEHDIHQSNDECGIFPKEFVQTVYQEFENTRAEQRAT